MQTPAKLTDLLCCPRCGGPLAQAERQAEPQAQAERAIGWSCGRCKGGYPVFGRIPCLVDDPALWRTLWLRRFDDYSSGIEARLRTLQQESEQPDLLPRTRQRLQRIAAGFAAQLEAIDSLLEPIQAGADLLPSAAIPSRPEPGAPAAILECYEHVFRDWVLGAGECAETLAFLMPLVPDGLGDVAV